MKRAHCTDLACERTFYDTKDPEMSLEETCRSNLDHVAAQHAEALAECERGEPAFALALGRELHWLDAEPYRDAALELLTIAYDALDFDAHAKTVRVHDAHRDLKTVDVY